MGTVKMRHSELRIVVGKVLLPMVLLVIAGIAIGGYVVFSGDLVEPGRRVVAASVPVPAAKDEPAAAPTAMAAVETPLVKDEPSAALPAELPANHEPLPAAPSAAAPAALGLAANPGGPGGDEPPAPAERAARTSMLVDVRIDSTPSGATVTLVDRGKRQFVGNTPVSAAVDASREYDLVFTLPNRATQVVHLDAKATQHVSVALGARIGGAKPAAIGPRRAEPASPEPAQAPPATEKVIEDLMP